MATKNGSLRQPTLTIRVRRHRDGHLTLFIVNNQTGATMLSGPYFREAEVIDELGRDGWLQVPHNLIKLTQLPDGTWVRSPLPKHRWGRISAKQSPKAGRRTVRRSTTTHSVGDIGSSMSTGRRGSGSATSVEKEERYTPSGVRVGDRSGKRRGSLDSTRPEGKVSCGGICRTLGDLQGPRLPIFGHTAGLTPSGSIFRSMRLGGHLPATGWAVRSFSPTFPPTLNLVFPVLRTGRATFSGAYTGFREPLSPLRSAKVSSMQSMTVLGWLFWEKDSLLLRRRF